VDAYRRFVRPFAGPRLSIVEAMLLGQHPGVRWLETAQVALSEIADYLRIGEG
jgi:hypothetical protein